jgi:hypothetical protein
MAAVTQLVPNFLGGVSRQTDDKKLNGQVVDSINAYPDPTYGLVKRGGSTFLWNLANASGDLFEEDDLKDAFWFYLESETVVTDANKDQYALREVGDRFTHPYIGCIAHANVHVWDSFNGTYQTVTNNGSAYLTRPDGGFYGANDFHYRSILDTTIICNRNVTVEDKDDGGSFTPGLVGTIRLNTVVPNIAYTATINGTDYTYTSEAQTSTQAILNGLRGAIPGSFNPTIYKTSIELSRGTAFTLTVKDGQSNTLMNSYQDTATGIEVLANPSKEGRLVEITGDADEFADNYFLKFTDGQWTETLDPTASSGFEDDTMPHRVFKKEDGTWEFGPCPWVGRLVGGEENNPMPSFVGHRISASFYFNNRLGFLSNANVIMSQAKDVYNFFAESQLATLDSDPIDLNANSTRPVNLYEVVTTPTGVTLFGTRQQFFLSAPETGVLTPTRSIIKAICSYESDYNIAPLDLGTTISFVSKMPDYSRLMLMQGQGEDVDPTVVEISKVVTGWLPGNLTMMAVSPQNSFVALASRNTRDMYIYKFYNDGQEDKMQAWTRWKLQGDIQACTIANDMNFVVTLQGGVYSVSTVPINDLTGTGFQYSTDSFKTSTPFIDFASAPSSVVYDEATKTTKFYVKFPLVSTLDPIVVLTLPASQTLPYASSYIDLLEGWQRIDSAVTDSDPGYWRTPETGTDATGDFFSVRGDFTEYINGIAIGYRYDYEVILPKFYFKLAAKNNAADYSASLTIGRVKFAIGKTGAVTFKLKAKGSDEWVDIYHVTDADYYEADTEPIKPEQIFTVPVNQRNKNFQLKVTSDLPFPVSLVSMMWEGQYTPRFYRRV